MGNFSQQMPSGYASDADVVLMLRAGRGDRAAFDELVLKYQKPVINAAYRYTGNPSVAEELAQDVFVRVYRAAANYRPEARFSTWLFTIVRNVCMNYRMREGRFDQQTDSESQTLPIPNNEESPESAAIRKDLEIRIRDAVLSLPETLRLPFVFHQFNHMQYDEVARALGISLSAVKVRIHRARQALTEKLKDYV